MTKKHKKWTPDWISEITTKVGKKVEEDKLFKKGEKKPDGTVVSKDEGETIKVTIENDVKELFDDRKKLEQELKDKKEELKKKAGYSDKYAQISIKHDELEELVKEWETMLNTNTAPAGYIQPTGANGNYVKQHRDFLKGTTAGGDGYGTGQVGWEKLVSVYNSKPITNLTTPNNAYTNLF